MGKNDKINKFSFRVDNGIKYVEEVRVVSDDINGVIMPIGEARRLAEERGLNLVLINQKTTPQIVKICDYGKFLYEYKKAQKEKNKNQTQLKEVQLSVNIAKHDMETKANNTKKFIEQGDKVRVVLSMKGRELDRREENKRSIFQFIEMVSDFAVPESMPKDEGTRTIVILKKKK